MRVAGKPKLPDAAPLIVTLALAEPDQTRFERQRQQYFPPALNYIPAHITLFHHLPGVELPGIGDALHQPAQATALFPVHVTEPMLLGRGVAWRLHSPVLSGLRAALAAQFDTWLTPQDRQPYRPHLTIQNKVSPDTARALFQELASGFVPFTTQAAALRLWHYRGGPWEEAGRFGFCLNIPKN